MPIDKEPAARETLLAVGKIIKLAAGGPIEPPDYHATQGMHLAAHSQSRASLGAGSAATRMLSSKESVDATLQLPFHLMALQVSPVEAVYQRIFHEDMVLKTKPVQQAFTVRALEKSLPGKDIGYSIAFWRFDNEFQLRRSYTIRS